MSKKTAPKAKNETARAIRRKAEQAQQEAERCARIQAEKERFAIACANASHYVNSVTRGEIGTRVSVQVESAGRFLGWVIVEVAVDFDGKLAISVVDSDYSDLPAMTDLFVPVETLSSPQFHRTQQAQWRHDFQVELHRIVRLAIRKQSMDRELMAA